MKCVWCEETSFIPLCRKCLEFAVETLKRIEKYFDKQRDYYRAVLVNNVRAMLIELLDVAELLRQSIQADGGTIKREAKSAPG